MSTRPLLAVILAAFALPSFSTAQDSLTLADFEGDIGSFQGLTRDAQTVHGGRASGLWSDHPKNTRALFRGIPTDWTGYDALEFWLHSEVANGAEFMLIISSENPATEGIDYWSEKLVVDWTGWRHLRIPLRQFGNGSRSPRGWDQVDYFYFTSSGWNCTPLPDTVIRFDDIVLTRDLCSAQLLDVKAHREGGKVVGEHTVRISSRVDHPISVRPVAEAPEGITVALAPEQVQLPGAGFADVVATVTMPARIGMRTEELQAPEVLIRCVAEGREPDSSPALSLPLGTTYFASFAVPPHPRVMLNEKLLADVLLRVKENERSAAIAASIIKSANGVVKSYAGGFPAEETASVEKGRVLPPRAETLAMAYLLTGDEQYAHQAARVISAAKDWSTWVYEFHKGLLADLGTAGALRHFGIAYDWAYNGMTEAERQGCRETIGVGLSAWLDAVRGGVWWHRSPRYNWTAVCCGGGGLAGLALLGEDPKAISVLAEAYPPVVRFLGFGGSDGGYPEGTSYWGYGVSHATLYAEALQVFTEGEVDLFKHPFLQATWQFPLYMHCPPAGTINFADCGYGRPDPRLTLQIGRQIGNPYAVWYYRNSPGSSTLDLLWDTPDLIAREPSDIPQSKHFRGIDWAALRSGWDRDATIFGIRGGNNGENHGMLECGNFVINSRGDRLIVDHGSQTYTHEYFSARRWESYRANSHGSNVVLVDDLDQLPGYDHMGHINDFFTSEAVDYLNLDATGTYPDFVKRLQRRVLFIKPDLLVMLDDVQAEGQRTYEWRCHPLDEQSTSLGEGAMRIANTHAQLATRWLLPEGASVTGAQAEGEDFHVSVKPPAAADSMQYLTVMLCGDTEHAEPLYAMQPVEARQAAADVPRVLLIMSEESNQWHIIAQMVRSQGFEVDWVGEPLVAQLPDNSASLAAYSAVLLVPLSGKNAGMTSGQMDALAGYVRGGGGLVMVGGTNSFGAGGFEKTALAELLPVQITRSDDNVLNVTQRPGVTAADHPLLAGLPAQWPAFGSAYGGYHDVRLKDGATQVLAVDPTVTENVPFIAAWGVGEGRVMSFGALWAFGTGEQFKAWQHARRFLGNMVQWLSGGKATPDAGRQGRQTAIDESGFSFPLSDKYLALSKGSGFVGLDAHDVCGGGGVAFRTGEGDLDAMGIVSDGDMLALLGTETMDSRDDLFAAISVTRVFSVDLPMLKASRPVSIAWWSEDGAGPGLLQCDAETEIDLSDPGGMRPEGVRLFVDGKATDWVFTVGAGRHELRFELE